MYKVVTKRFLNDAKTICLFEIEAPLIARHAQAGQFVVFRLDEQGERVPVSVAGYDREKGTVTVMVQAAGRTTKMLHTVEQGDVISDIVGPLGKATEMDGLKKVCVVGGGVGCAIAYPIAREMHERGIDVTFIAGFRSADIVILKDELKAGVLPKKAVSTGFSKALWTILDSNITTIIAAVVLIFFGSSAVRGFATTLAIGIVSSLFTSLFLSHLLMDLTVGERISISWRRRYAVNEEN